MAISKQRKGLLTTVLLAAAVGLVWLVMMQSGGRWGLFPDRWPMSLVMVLGSLVAGATPEGGGAIAFPALTLVFGIDPEVARDFSLMIQAVGMTAAAVTLVIRADRIHWRVIGIATAGGAVGVILGLELLAPALPAAYAKMFFTSIWLSFAFALYYYWSDITPGSAERRVLGRPQPATDALVLGMSVAGGLITSVTGSGLDIYVFTTLVLFFRISESVATMHAVIIMAANAVLGFAWRVVGQGGTSELAWEYWWVSVPIVVIGAPLGAQLLRYGLRQHVSRFLFATIVVQYVYSLLSIRQTGVLLLFSLAIVVTTLALFKALAELGLRYSNQNGAARDGPR